jgi:hypothetical protein
MYVTLVNLPRVTSCHTASPLVDPLFLWNKSFLMYGDQHLFLLGNISTMQALLMVLANSLGSICLKSVLMFIKLFLIFSNMLSASLIGK